MTTLHGVCPTDVTDIAKALRVNLVAAVANEIHFFMVARCQWRAFYEIPEFCKPQFCVQEHFEDSSEVDDRFLEKAIIQSEVAADVVLCEYLFAFFCYVVLFNRWATRERAVDQAIGKSLTFRRRIGLR